MTALLIIVIVVVGFLFIRGISVDFAHDKHITEGRKFIRELRESRTSTHNNKWLMKSDSTTVPISRIRYTYK